MKMRLRMRRIRRSRRGKTRGWESCYLEDIAVKLTIVSKAKDARVRSVMNVRLPY